jgi:hypothetical protein
MGLGHFLSGKISDRIRGGKLPKNVQLDLPRTQPAPSSKAVRGGSGQGLGKGATRRRGSGDES